ncbi:hypothetical protein [Piscinibacter sakaiensis]|uniref:hypothetical protein n=1 Tax=Piscinibacter sakaiensis TaxID=1547922 RepID=UPI0006B69299|nr:hypothetical protein [Piscinibacter sakaiensis]
MRGEPPAQWRLAAWPGAFFVATGLLLAAAGGLVAWALTWPADDPLPWAGLVGGAGVLVLAAPAAAAWRRPRGWWLCHDGDGDWRCRAESAFDGSDGAPGAAGGPASRADRVAAGRLTVVLDLGRALLLRLDTDTRPRTRWIAVTTAGQRPADAAAWRRAVYSAPPRTGPPPHGVPAGSPAPHRLPE